MTPEQARQMSPKQLESWYMEATGSFDSPLRVHLDAEKGHLWVQPQFRWTNDDEELPNEGMVEVYDVRDIMGNILFTESLEKSPFA